MTSAGAAKRRLAIQFRAMMDLGELGLQLVAVIFLFYRAQAAAALAHYADGGAVDRQSVSRLRRVGEPDLGTNELLN
jgi:hypothetical protein